ncbi:MAG: tetratricopeptide repeat protein, partial [Bacteroidota bacterium]
LDSGYNIAISEGNLEMASGFLVNKGLYHYYRRDLDSSIYYYNQSLILEEKLGRKDKVARRLRNIGLSYKQKGLFRQSLLYYQRALDIADHLDDNKLMASINNSIGLLYQGLNEYHESLKYLQSAKVLYQLEDYKKGLSTAYLNIGNVKNAQGDKEQALTDYFRSLKLARLSDSRVDNALKNIGEVYLDLDSLHLAVDYLAQA